jgi:hypothetical protein
METASLAVVEWPPAAECFSAAAHTVRSAIREVTRRYVASLTTEGANGRRWLSNLMRNFMYLERPVVPEAEPDTDGTAACLIVAAGPSLEDQLGGIREARDRLALWVAGSALDAVLASGLEPDLVVTADPAVYATEYLRAALADRSRAFPIAGPLSGSRGFADSGPVQALSHGDPAETLLYGALNGPPQVLPAHGTVTGTALHLAMATAEWPVVLAGMDFAWRDMQSHARPHASDIYEAEREDRLAPRPSELYARSRNMTPVSGPWRAGASLRVYGDWFERSPLASSGRLRRLGPSPTVPSIPGISSSELGSLPNLFPRFCYKNALWPSPDERRDVARSVREKLFQALRRVDTRSVDPVQMFLLRRLAPDRILRWAKSRTKAELEQAVSHATTQLDIATEIAR